MTVPRLSSAIRRVFRFSFCVMLGVLLASGKGVAAPAQSGAIASHQESAAAPTPTPTQLHAATDDPLKAVQAGKTYYQSGQDTAAVGAWLPAAQAFAKSGRSPKPSGGAEQSGAGISAIGAMDRRQSGDRRWH